AARAQRLGAEQSPPSDPTVPRRIASGRAGRNGVRLRNPVSRQWLAAGVAKRRLWLSSLPSGGARGPWLCGRLGAAVVRRTRRAGGAGDRWRCSIAPCRDRTLSDRRQQRLPRRGRLSAATGYPYQPEGPNHGDARSDRRTRFSRVRSGRRRRWTHQPTLAPRVATPTSNPGAAAVKPPSSAAAEERFSYLKA